MKEKDITAEVVIMDKEDKDILLLNRDHEMMIINPYLPEPIAMPISLVPDYSDYVDGKQSRRNRRAQERKKQKRRH